MHSHPEVMKEQKYEQQRARESASEKLNTWLQREARPCIGACKVKQALSILQTHRFKKKKQKQNMHTHTHRSARTYKHTHRPGNDS